AAARLGDRRRVHRILYNPLPIWVHPTSRYKRWHLVMLGRDSTMPRVKHQPIADEEADRLISMWIEKSDAEAVGMAVGLIEDRLGFAIKTCFVDMPLRGNTDKLLTEAVLFQGYGPLATFVAKIDIACALGIVTAKQRANLHVIRTIRNAL